MQKPNVGPINPTFPVLMSYNLSSQIKNLPNQRGSRAVPWPNACQVLYKQTLLSPDLEESFLTGMAGQVQLAILDLQFKQLKCKSMVLFFS